MTQLLLAGLIVAACAAHVLWALLLPASWKQRAQQALRRGGAPERTATGCEACAGCGCGRAAATRPPAVQVRPVQPLQRSTRRPRRG
jgi:hypothetical protein